MMRTRGYRQILPARAEDRDEYERVANTSLLRSTCLSEQYRTLYELNETSSALLRLPPELRSRIWSALLSDEAINVDYAMEAPFDGRPILQAYQYSKYTDDMREARRLQADDDIVGPQSQQRQHMRLAARHESLPLVITQVSRQVYHETALLIFDEGHYRFQSTAAMDMFLKRTLPAQARAIRSISVIVEVSDKVGDDWSMMVSSRLTGLERVVCFAESYGVKDTRDRIRKNLDKLVEMLRSNGAEVIVVAYRTRAYRSHFETGYSSCVAPVTALEIDVVGQAIPTLSRLQAILLRL
ncbi:hypothetical protein LTR15_004147 [Elasticomyces elasticus]|nr:hypothetical protein LTR15_004147 [Elasticomyces elasticus]